LIYLKKQSSTINGTVISYGVESYTIHIIDIIE
jgi:hypothetical protein